MQASPCVQTPERHTYPSPGALNPAGLSVVAALGCAGPSTSGKWGIETALLPERMVPSGAQQGWDRPTGSAAGRAGAHWCVHRLVESSVPWQRGSALRGASHGSGHWGPKRLGCSISHEKKLLLWSLLVHFKIWGECYQLYWMRLTVYSGNWTLLVFIAHPKRLPLKEEVWCTILGSYTWEFLSQSFLYICQFSVYLAHLCRCSPGRWASSLCPSALHCGGLGAHHHFIITC